MGGGWYRRKGGGERACPSGVLKKSPLLNKEGGDNLDSAG